VIESSVILFTLILARTGTFVALMPLFGGRNVPKLVKVGLALALAAMWFGSVSSSGVETIVTHSAAGWLGLGVALGREAALGAIFGFAFGLVLVPARVAGEYIGQEMGLSMASLADPMAESQSGLMGQVFEMLGVLIFFGLDGHHVFLAALHGSFARVPVGGCMGAVPVGALVAGVASAEEWGLLLAAPLAVCLFITSVVLALMARAAPQLNILSVGFGLRLAVGLVAVLVLLPEIGLAMGGVVGRITDVLRELV
jgi:flagellar biosynthetic protein FliR